MNGMNMNKYLIFPILLIILLTVGAASADENITLSEDTDSQSPDDIPIIEEDLNETSEISQQAPCLENTKIESKEVTTYHKENAELVGYLKDSNNQPISNKSVSIFINSKTYNKITDKYGKIVLKLNLKPNTYKATIRFGGDENFTASMINVMVNVKQIPLAIKTNNFNTYVGSDLYFKAKVFNKVTKTPIKGIKVLFKVFIGHNKYKKYYATTDENGLAILKKNFKVGSYKIIASVKKNKKIKSKARLTVKATAEMGCTSIYIQVNKTEAVAGFRRDSTYAANLNIKVSKWHGRTAIKQYKTTNTYFFHSITTSDGWMIGTGGADNPSVNKAIEKLAGKMVKSGKIKKTTLKKIQRYEKRLGIGHFAIKAPNGKYAVVWGSSIKTGKLKSGQYISVPNRKSLFRHGSYYKFSKDPANAAIKILATDSFGINRRDATVFHWKSITNEGSTTSKVFVYAANDNGHLAGKNTGHLKDNIYFKGTFFSKNKLPKTPNKLFLGVHDFGSIDKLIKIQTKVDAPELTKTLNESKTFDITVKEKKTQNPIKNIKIKIKIADKVYTVKTDAKGVVKFNTNSLDIGTYKVTIYSGNKKYYVSAKSTIIIK
jgi:hypothetical protein